jgi:hypothetical protein
MSGTLTLYSVGAFAKRTCHQQKVGASTIGAAKLDASIGASGPHDFAVRISAVRRRHISVHRISRPTSVTIAIRPSKRARDSAE